MLENVLKAPMSFFDTNPKGRVVNRFAKDVDYVDRAIPMTLEALLRLLFQVFTKGLRNDLKCHFTCLKRL
jgi:ABC-type multidrug transport system fused ATPase/permease subunit